MVPAHVHSNAPFAPTVQSSVPVRMKYLVPAVQRCRAWTCLGMDPVRSEALVPGEHRTDPPGPEPRESPISTEILLEA